jgi:hypothetical protein
VILRSNGSLPPESSKGQKGYRKKEEKKKKKKNFNFIFSTKYRMIINDVSDYINLTEVSILT